jgi:hypothetical protein
VKRRPNEESSPALRGHASCYRHDRRRSDRWRTLHSHQKIRFNHTNPVLFMQDVHVESVDLRADSLHVGSPCGFSASATGENVRAAGGHMPQPSTVQSRQHAVGAHIPIWSCLQSRGEGRRSGDGYGDGYGDTQCMFPDLCSCRLETWQRSNPSRS